jgi:hypothetical protein
MFTDVLIDTGGAVTGMLVSMLLMFIIGKNARPSETE